MHVYCKPRKRNTGPARDRRSGPENVLYISGDVQANEQDGGLNLDTIIGSDEPAILTAQTALSLSKSRGTKTWQWPAGQQSPVMEPLLATCSRELREGGYDR